MGDEKMFVFADKLSKRKRINFIKCARFNQFKNSWSSVIIKLFGAIHTSMCYKKQSIKIAF